MDLSYLSVMNRILSRVISLKFVFAFALIVTFAGIKTCYDYLSSAISWNSDETFFIESGTSLEKIIKELSARNIVRVPEKFLRTYAVLTSFRGSIKAGEYNLSHANNVIELIELLRSGNVLKRKITFIEGWTFEQWRNHLKKSPYINQKLGGQKNDEAMAMISEKADRMPEGYFFPDTYQFTRGDSDIQILKRAHNKMVDVLGREWANRRIDGSLKDTYEVLILASIIERETGVRGDRRKVSQVFLNRLRQNIRLQSDPTVIYGLGGAFDGDLTRRDLRTPTPFNTYTNLGLPPTPIGMPSLASIRAALDPEEGEYLYFVARGDGTTYFSKTLTEHNQAVEKYQRSGRLKKYQSTPK